MEDVSLAHAKEHLEELFERARHGEEVRITDDQGHAVKLSREAQKTAEAPPYPPRVFGLMKHLAEIPDDQLFAPLTEEELAWLSGETSEVDK